MEASRRLEVDEADSECVQPGSDPPFAPGHPVGHGPGVVDQTGKTAADARGAARAVSS